MKKYFLSQNEICTHIRGSSIDFENKLRTTFF